MQITICGGGNAAHTLAGLLAARKGLEVNVYAPYGDEAQCWFQGITARGGISVVTPSGTLLGRPHQISANPGKVVPGSELVLLALPAFAHESILHDIAPHLDAGVWVGALPARGGFQWSAKRVLASRGANATLFGLQTLPWACRIQQYGQEVIVLGTKVEVDLATWPSQRAEETAALLTDLLGLCLRPISGFLSLTLAGTGQLIHPGVMYGLFHNWHGHRYTEAPLFYQGINATTADTLQRLSDEVQILRADLEQRFPDLDLSAVRPLGEWLCHSYGGAIADTSSLQSCFVTNQSYAGLRAPMCATDDGFVPDFRSRYLIEDVPYGLVVTRGIAAMAQIATPTMDQVITWAQDRLGQEYLVEGKLQGQDVATSRAPQRYGFGRLEDVIHEG